MRHAGGLLALACFLIFVVNEAIRAKYGFVSNRHFALFWVVLALALVGMGIALGMQLYATAR